MKLSLNRQPRRLRKHSLMGYGFEIKAQFTGQASADLLADGDLLPVQKRRYSRELPLRGATRLVRLERG